MSLIMSTLRRELRCGRVEWRDSLVMELSSHPYCATEGLRRRALSEEDQLARGRLAGLAANPVVVEAVIFHDRSGWRLILKRVTPWFGSV